MQSKKRKKKKKTERLCAKEKGNAMQANPQEATTSMRGVDPVTRGGQPPTLYRHVGGK